MTTWSISEAKAKLSEVVRRCQKEPQMITRRGVPVAEMISVTEFLRLGGRLPDMSGKRQGAGAPR